MDAKYNLVVTGKFVVNIAFLINYISTIVTHCSSENVERENDMGENIMTEWWTRSSAKRREGGRGKNVRTDLPGWFC